jgi:hypothetical protein
MPLALYLAVVSMSLLIAIYSVVEISSKLLAHASLKTSLSQFSKNERALSDRQANTAPNAAIFMVGAAATVQAKLLKNITEEINSNSGTVISSAVLDAAGGGQKFRTAIDIEFSISNDNLQRLLYQVESEVPFIFVTNLAITADGDTGVLHVKMTVSGLPRKASSGHDGSVR